VDAKSAFIFDLDCGSADILTVAARDEKCYMLAAAEETKFVRESPAPGRAADIPSAVFEEFNACFDDSAGANCHKDFELTD
jgi:hypothetical protein